MGMVRFCTAALLLLVAAGCVEDRGLAGTRLCGETISPADFPAMEKTLTDVLPQAQSTAEFRTWLESQKCVRQVVVLPVSVLTDPPIQEFRVEFAMEGNRTETREIDVYLYQSGTPRLATMGKNLGYAGMHE